MWRKVACGDMEGEVTLYGQLSTRPYFCSLPAPVGKRVQYEITVQEGHIRFNHSAFNEDGGTWSCPPSGGQRAHYDIHAGESVSVELVVGENWGKADHVEIVNTRMREIATLSYSCVVL